MSAAPVSLPVLVVVPSGRHLGIVAMDGTFHLLEVRRHYLRRFPDEAKKAEAVRKLLGAAVGRMEPATLVIEHDADGRRSPVRDALVSAIEAVGREAGIAVVRASFRDACAVIVESGLARDVAEALAKQYPFLAHEIGPDSAATFRGTDRRRRLRPILAALAIAYALVRDTIVKKAC